MAEQAIVDACVRELDRRRLLHFNLGASNGETGLPDRVVILAPHGRVLGLEFKTARGRVHAKQAWTHEQWRRAGARVEVVRSVQELRRVLDEIDKED